MDGSKGCKGYLEPTEYQCAKGWSNWRAWSWRWPLDLKPCFPDRTSAEPWHGNTELKHWTEGVTEWTCLQLEHLYACGTLNLPTEHWSDEQFRMKGDFGKNEPQRSKPKRAFYLSMYLTVLLDAGTWMAGTLMDWLADRLVQWNCSTSLNTLAYPLRLERHWMLVSLENQKLKGSLTMSYQEGVWIFWRV